MNGGITGFVLAMLAAYGVFLIFSATSFGWRGVGIGDRRNKQRSKRRLSISDQLVQAGLHDVRPAEFLAVSTTLLFVGAGLAFALFGGLLPALSLGGMAGAAPYLAARSRRASRLARARESWPRLIEEIRIQTVSLGRSVPQSLFTVGRRAPEEMQRAFADAHREWLISTDFDRTLAVLKAALADPTADAVCETLLIAHEVGGTDVGDRLSALIDDRLLDLAGRKDAEAKQAGAKFARNFVLLVPLGMALVGQTIAAGRDAYGSPGAQVAIVVAIAIIAACWQWAGRLMLLPEEERVFLEDVA